MVNCEGELQTASRVQLRLLAFLCQTAVGSHRLGSTMSNSLHSVFLLQFILLKLCALIVSKLCAVDSLYVASFGRRKTWLVPVQYLIGVTMFVLSLKVIFLVGHMSLGCQKNCLQGG